MRPEIALIVDAFVDPIELLPRSIRMEVPRVRRGPNNTGFCLGRDYDVESAASQTCFVPRLIYFSLLFFLLFTFCSFRSPLASIFALLGIAHCESEDLTYTYRYEFEIELRVID